MSMMNTQINVREDLLELSTEALLALANAGFVKRAQKDIAAGVLPALRQDEDGSVHAEFEDGVLTSIAASASLRDAACNCPATSMCRHRVTLVLAYQALHAQSNDTAAEAGSEEMDTQWSPAHFDDAAMAACFTPLTLEQAVRLATTRPLATVSHARLTAQGMQAPSVKLPMSHVRFFSRSSLAHARCDCQQGSACVHIVLATWAFRLAQQMQPGVAEVTLEVLPHGQLPDTRLALMDSPAAQQVINEVQAFLTLIWRKGSAQPLLGLEAAHARLQAGLQNLGWTWLQLALNELWQQLQAQAQRSSRFDDLDLLDAMSQLWARLQTAMHADQTAEQASRLPASQILGIGQKGEVALDTLRLVSLGAELWRDDTHEGASLVFADPDTQTVSVLERNWPRAEQDDGNASSLLARRIANLPVRQLAASQIISKAAKRRANAGIELGANARQTNALPLSNKSWDDLQAPLKFLQLEQLISYLRQRPPACVNPAQLSGNWHILELTELELQDWSWDGARQTLVAAWQDADENSLCCYLPYQQLSAGAVDAMARALKGEWGNLLSIAGPAWLEHGGITIRPMSIMTTQRAIVLALEAANPQIMEMQQIPFPVSARQNLLRESRHLLAQLLRQGLHQLTPALRSRLQAQAAQLREAGFDQCAGMMHDSSDDQAIARLSTLSLLLAELQT